MFKRFSLDQSCCGRSGAGGLLCTLSTKDQLFGMLISSSSFHGSSWRLLLPPFITFNLARKEWQDLSIRIAIPSSWILQCWIIMYFVRNSQFRILLANIWRLILAKIGYYCNVVDSTVPIIMRRPFRCSLSINLQ